MIGTIAWYMLVRFSFDGIDAAPSFEAVAAFNPTLKDVRKQLEEETKGLDEKIIELEAALQRAKDWLTQMGAGD